MRRPSFQFYPMDWLTDPALCACSFEAQGVWMRLLCVMHQCDPYGHLSTNGKPMKPEEIRRHLPGFSLQKVRKTMEELEKNGVFSLTAEGVIYSRRMVADEAVRMRCSAGGSKGAGHGIKGAAYGAQGGRPRAQNPPSPEAGRGVPKPPPSSSSSKSPPTPSAQATDPAQPEAPATSTSVEPFKVPPGWSAWCAANTPALMPNLEDVAQAFAQHIGTKAPTLESWRQFCKDAARQLHAKPVAA